MRIHQIHLKNFRGFADQVISFHDSHTLLKGDHGSGKSSVLMALAWAITGVCRETQANGNKWERLCSWGHNHMGVKVDSDVATFARQRGPDGHRLQMARVEASDPDQVQGLLYERLGIDKVAALALFDPMPLLDRDPAAQKQTISRILKPDPIEITPLMSKYGIEALESLEQLDKLCKGLKDKTLRDLNRDSKRLNETCPQEPEWPKPGKTAEQLKAGREKLRKKVESLQAAERARAKASEAMHRNLAEQLHLKNRLTPMPVECPAKACPVLEAFQGSDAAAKNAEIEAELKRLTEGYLKLDKEHKAAQAHADKDQQALDKARQQLAVADTVLAQVADYERAAKLVKTHQQERDRTAAAVREVDKLIADLAAEHKRQVEVKVGGVLTVMNLFLRTIGGPAGGGSLGYTAEGGFEDELSEVDRWSDTERRQILEAAFRVAAAKATGIDVAVIEHSAPMTKGLERSLAKALRASGCQVIQAYATDDQGKPPGDGAPWGGWWLTRAGDVANALDLRKLQTVGP